MSLAKSKNWNVYDTDGGEYAGSEDGAFIPAPVTGTRIKFTSGKAVGESILMIVQTTAENLWLDLNNNGEYDNGEELEMPQLIQVPIQSQDFTLYGAADEIVCSSNKLTKIEFAYMEGLKKLVCQSNALSELDLSNCPNLLELDCGRNKLNTIDLSKTPLLTDLYCYENGMTSLDLSKCTQLKLVYCAKNKLQNLALAGLGELQELYCNENQITDLDLSQCPKLKKILFYFNQVSEESMQSLVESLPTVAGSAENVGIFKPIIDLPELEEPDENVCNTDQAAIAKAKNWRVLDTNDNDYAGTTPTSVEQIASQPNLKYYSKEGVLTIEGLTQAQLVSLYRLDGSFYYSGMAEAEQLRIVLPMGSYILRIAERNFNVQI